MEQAGNWPRRPSVVFCWLKASSQSTCIPMGVGLDSTFYWEGLQSQNAKWGGCQWEDANGKSGKLGAFWTWVCHKWACLVVQLLKKLLAIQDLQPDCLQTLGRSPGEGNGYPLPYSGLEKLMDCIVHGVTKSRCGWVTFSFTATNILSSKGLPAACRALVLNVLLIGRLIWYNVILCS